MNEWEERIQSILSDSTQMQTLAGLAQSLMGGAAPASESAPPALDPALLQRLSGLMQGSAPSGRAQALLAAMQPYLSEKRRGKLDKAMQLAHMARLARLAMGEGGGAADDAAL